jgi:peptide/nickel transport system permease protein
VKRLLRNIFGRATAAVSLVILVLLAISAIGAPLLAPKNPSTLNVANALQPPGPGQPMGTDELGRDVFSRVLYGGRVSLFVAVASGIGAAVAGTAIGLAVGYFRRLDTPVMLVMDGLMAFPGILLALAIVAALRPSTTNLILTLILVYAPRVARVVRSAVLVVREMDYITASHALGVPTARVLGRHLLPNVVAPALVQMTLVLAFALLSEAGLSFLGVGTSPSQPSWGTIIADGRLVMRVAPWLTIYPGLAITVTVLAVNVIGDAMRDALDPKLRGT